MDLTSLYYFSELAKELNMTKTAERLFVSQQTFSNHIIRLENELGVKLLHRKPTLSLTCAGEKVLSFANVINKEFANLKDVLSDVEKEKKGVIHFGASSMRMNSCLPNVLGEFSKRFPQVDFRLTDAVSSQLEPMVLDGKLDFALILEGEPNAKLNYQRLLCDQVYLCVPEHLLVECFGENTSGVKERALNGANVADFACLPFCFSDSRLGKKIMKCFDDCGVKPDVRLTCASNRIATSLALKGISACFTTQMCLMDSCEKIPNNLNVFPVYNKGKPLFEQLVLVSSKERYVPSYSKYFLELLKDYFNKLEQIRIKSR